MSPALLDLDGAFECKAARHRGNLAHSMLKNTYLLLGLGPLVDLLSSGRSDFLAETREELEGIVSSVSSYSPSRLVDLLSPLSELPEKRREHLRKRLEEAFKAGFDPEGVAKKLADARKPFLKALDHFVECAGETEDSNLAGAHARLRRTACRLLAVLDQLPRGIWIP